MGTRKLAQNMSLVFLYTDSGRKHLLNLEYLQFGLQKTNPSVFK